MEEQKKTHKLVRQTSMVGNVLSLGLTGGICLALSLFAGYHFDRCFSSEPWGIIAGILIGLAAAATQTWKQLQESMGQFDRENERIKSKNTQM